MTVNYYGIMGCTVQWDQNGAYLVPPAGTPVPALQQAGFATAPNGFWFRRLNPQETQIVQSNSNMPVLTLPPAGAPGMGAVQEETPEEKQKANKLCIISLAMMYGGGALYSLFTKIGNSNLLGILGTLSLVCSLAAFILMIVVRVKYPKNKFGKILMIIYLVQLILGVLAFVALVAFCGYIASSCRGF